MAVSASKKLRGLIDAQQAIQELALMQLVEEFIEHLDEMYQRAVRRGDIAGSISIKQWLGEQGDYSKLIDNYYHGSTQLFLETVNLVESVSSLEQFADELEPALNDKYNEGAGHLYVRALVNGDERDEEVLVTFKYDALYAWSD